MNHARLGLLLPLALAACTAYDAPPEITLDRPADGAFRVGDPLTLRFSEPVDPATLAIRAWPASRDLDGEIPAGTAPLLETCHLADAPCGDADLSLAEDGLTAAVALNRSTLGGPNQPLIVEVDGALADLAGSARNLPDYFDVQFKPARTPNTEPVEFDDGVYVVVAEIDDPLPAVITLITDVTVAPDGSVALVAAKGKAIGDAPKNTRDPAQLEVTATEQGFALFDWGFVQLTDGERFLETDPIEVHLAVGVIVIVIHDIRINGKIVTNPDTGVDRIDGTVSFSGLTLNPGEGESNYPADNKSFSADRAPDDLVPTGTPEVCGELCGAVTAQCEPPFDFPGAGMCD